MDEGADGPATPRGPDAGGNGDDLVAWIKVDKALIDHPKVAEATARIGRGCDAFKLAGHLVTLWGWALEAAPQGGPLTVAQVAHGARWPGKPAPFVEALRLSGLLDQRGAAFWIHDYLEYAGAYLRERERSRARSRERPRGTAAGTAVPPGAPAAAHSAVHPRFRRGLPLIPDLRSGSDPDPEDEDRGTAAAPTAVHGEGLDVRERLLGVHEELTLGRLWTARDGERTDRLLALGLTHDHIDTALADLGSWSPRDPWTAFCAAAERTVAAAAHDERRRLLGGVDDEGRPLDMPRAAGDA